MEIKKIWENIEFGPKIFFSTDWEIKNKAINLFKEEWKAIAIDKNKEFIIDYTWEYEKYNIYIQAIKWNTNRLNFFIQDYENKEFFAFIQDPSVLENLDLSKYPSRRYYLDDIVFTQIERLWFEGETVKI